MLAFGGSDTSFRQATLRRVCLAVGLVVLAAHAVHLVSVFGGLAVDDAYISFRYADSLASGTGLSYNPGELVEGYSNFLWVVLLAPFAILTEDLTLLSMVLGIGFTLVSAAIMERVLVDLYGFRGASTTALAILLAAVSGYVAGWAGSGMETGLHGFLLIGGWYRFCLEQSESDRRPLSAFLLLGLALTRPEGLFVALAGVLLHVRLSLGQGHRLFSRRTILFAAIVLGGHLAYHGWRFSYYGRHFFPNAVRAKVGSGAEQLRRGLAYLRVSFLVPYLPLLLSPILLVFRRARLASWTGVALLVGHLAFVAAVGGDWSYGRFFAPFLPLAFTLFAATAGHVAARVPEGKSWVRAAAVGAVVSVLGFSYLTYRVTGVEREQAFRLAFAPKDRERVRIGRWLREASDPDTVVAVYAAGQVPYYSHRYSHDMLGLNDAHIAGLDSRGLGRGLVGHEKFDVAYTLDTVRPDVIVDAHLVEGLLDHERLHAEYRRLTTFQHNSVYVRRTSEWARTTP